MSKNKRKLNAIDDEPNLIDEDISQPANKRRRINKSETIKTALSNSTKKDDTTKSITVTDTTNDTNDKANEENNTETKTTTAAPSTTTANENNKEDNTTDENNKDKTDVNNKDNNNTNKKEESKTDDKNKFSFGNFSFGNEQSSSNGYTGLGFSGFDTDSNKKDSNNNDTTNSISGWGASNAEVAEFKFDTNVNFSFNTSDNGTGGSGGFGSSFSSFGSFGGSFTSNDGDNNNKDGENNESNKNTNENNDSSNGNNTSSSNAWSRPKIEMSGEVDPGDTKDVTYCTARVKIYKLKNGQYKERGVGDIKVNSVKHEESKKMIDSARLLCRREKIGKLILNEFIQKDTKFEIENEKFLRVAFVSPKCENLSDNEDELNNDETNDNDKNKDNNTDNDKDKEKTESNGTTKKDDEYIVNTYLIRPKDKSKLQELKDAIEIVQEMLNDGDNEQK